MTNNGEDANEIEPFSRESYSDATFGDVGSGSTYSIIADGGESIRQWRRARMKTEQWRKHQEKSYEYGEWDPRGLYWVLRSCLSGIWQDYFGSGTTRDLK